MKSLATASLLTMTVAVVISSDLYHIQWHLNENVKAPHKALKGVFTTIHLGFFNISNGFLPRRHYFDRLLMEMLSLTLKFSFPHNFLFCYVFVLLYFHVIRNNFKHTTGSFHGYSSLCHGILLP